MATENFKAGIGLLAILAGLYITVIGLAGFAIGGILLSALVGVPLTVAGVRMTQRNW